MSKTNFEKIKEMSIDELAYQLCMVLRCDRCPVTNKCQDWVRVKYCFENLKQWLESECEE